MLEKDINLDIIIICLEVYIHVCDLYASLYSGLHPFLPTFNFNDHFLIVNF